MADRQTVDFWFDPLCPWTWMTSRWLLEVTGVRPVDVRWNLVSLAYLDEREARETGEEATAQDATERRGPGRVLAAARKAHGDDMVPALYTAFGTKYHVEGDDVHSAIEASVAEVGLAEELAEAKSASEHDDAIEGSHRAAIEAAGMETGPPIIGVDGTAFFGPVVSPTPRGEQAGLLWDAVVTAASTPGFYELKRGRDKGPTFD